MERQLPQLKVWKIDWEFIVSNYLDKSLWNKSWHLFQYKDIIIDLNISSINCESTIVIFKLKCNKLHLWEYETVSYNVENTSIKILQQQIHGTIWRLLMKYDRKLICESDGYYRIEKSQTIEEDRLRGIAESFLDENNVTNETIRQVYIDNYVSNNCKVAIMLANYCDYNMYQYATEPLLAFCSATGDVERKKQILTATKNNPNIQLVLNEVEEFSKTLSTDAFEDAMTNELEAI